MAIYKNSETKFCILFTCKAAFEIIGLNLKISVIWQNINMIKQDNPAKYKIYWAEGSKHDGFSWASGIDWNGGDQRKFQTVINNKPKTLT